jgi:hypothetical protein
MDIPSTLGAARSALSAPKPDLTRATALASDAAAALALKAGSDSNFSIPQVATYAAIDVMGDRDGVTSGIRFLDEAIAMVTALDGGDTAAFKDAMLGAESLRHTA